MIHCDYCDAPLLSITTVCPNCHREQPPYPPVLPGGGGKSYSGWAGILLGFAAMSAILAGATWYQSSYNVPSAWIYGPPSNAFSSNPPVYLFPNADGSGGIYPGDGYALLFGGIALILVLWAFVSYNRGRSIDRANHTLLRSLERNAQENSNGH